jgi:ABC-2 type transport system ATP-binding protein
LDEPTTGLDPHSRITVWSEIQRLNTDLAMTIFLTTQYLEEADELADRVGIINDGRLVAEGSPATLKRSVGNDVIVARLEGSVLAAQERVERVPGVQGAEGRGDELVVTADDGAATIGAVAVALNAVTTVRHLTLRTPTLDDVFLELTGNRIETGETNAEADRNELVEVAS